MWVFAYGSLMFDGWEERFGGERFERARLPGFRRSFNKSSTENWGTPERPGPTLGLEPEPGGECVGCAFRFPEEREPEVLAYLDEREGYGFELRRIPVELPDGRRVLAVVAVNDHDASTYIGDLELDERAAMARRAEGRSGTCREYVHRVREMLRELSVEEPRVTRFWDAVAGDPPKSDAREG